MKWFREAASNGDPVSAGSCAGERLKRRLREPLTPESRVTGRCHTPLARRLDTRNVTRTAYTIQVIALSQPDKLQHYHRSTRSAGTLRHLRPDPIQKASVRAGAGRLPGPDSARQAVLQAFPKTCSSVKSSGCGASRWCRGCWNERSAQPTAVFLLLLLVVTSPLPLGSNREWSWALCALWPGLVAWPG